MPVELSELKKRFVAPDGTVVPVIDIPLFSLADAEHVALVGGSGTGKTTLLHLIAGILTPDSGRIVFVSGSNGRAASAPWSLKQAAASFGATTAATAVLDYASSKTQQPGPGVDITRLSEAERDIFRGRFIGYIFQTHHLLPGFTALENVLLGMSFTGRPHEPAWARHLLQEVGLGDRLDYRPAKLSVGQQQRVAVARALASRPRLVLADEPTGALDPRNAQQVLELIRKLSREVGASLLLVSHDPQITSQFGRVVMLGELNRASMG